MNKVVGLVVALLGFTVIQPTQAAETKTIAIIDTAVDSSKIPNVIYEVCFTYLNTCPNKTSFQEGQGSANINGWRTIKSDIDHGHNVAQAAVTANPNINIVFIRVADEKTATTYHDYDQSREKAMIWLTQNAARFNIQAVSLSKAISLHTDLTCSKNASFNTFVSSVNSLSLQNVKVFAGTGNASSKDKIGFPACVPGVIGVGALKPDLTMARYTNTGPGLDVVARGDAIVKRWIKNTGNCVNVIKYIQTDTKTKECFDSVNGTSVASPVAATLYVTNKNNNTWDNFNSLLPKAVGYSHIS